MICLQLKEPNWTNLTRKPTVEIRIDLLKRNVDIFSGEMGVREMADDLNKTCR